MSTARFRLIVILFLFLVSSTVLLASENQQDGALIDFDSAWKMMKANNLELQRLQIDQEILIREAVNKKYWIPGIGAGASLSRNSPFISRLTNPENADRTEADNWSVRGSLDVRLGINFNISLEDQKEALELNILMLERQSRLRDLRTALKKLYFQITAGFNTIDLLKQSMTLAQNRQERIETQYNQGLRSDLEVLTAKIAAARDLPSFQKAEVEQEKRMITFRDYLGLEENTPFTLPPDSERLSDGFLNSTAEDLSLRILNNESLKIAELELQLAEINKELTARNLYSPSLNLSLGWSSSLNPLFDADSWTADDWNDGIGLGVSVSVPLDAHIEGTSDQLNLQRLDDNIRKMKLSLEESRAKLKNEFQFMLLDLEYSRSNIEVSQLNVALQEQNFRKVQENFNTGRSSLLDLDDSRQELRSAQLSLENEKLNQLLIQIDLERLAGPEDDYN